MDFADKSAFHWISVICGERSMQERPNFSEIKSYDEFQKYYWYRQELSAICRQLGIDHTGTKQELNCNIKEYFNGNRIQKRNTKIAKKAIKAVTLDCPLLDCGFCFNAHFREFFSRQTGVEPFRFTADMATAWRKVKRENDRTFTLQDMLEMYYGKSDYAQYDNTSCQWNRFLKDFCADERNIHVHSKMRVASILWREVRNSPTPKIYCSELIGKYWSLIQEYYY